MKINLKSVFTHFFVLTFFVLASLSYFYPVLQGKVIFQSDIALYTGMAKEQNDFRVLEGEEPYWTNSAFGGMPTYQLGANYPNNFVKQLDRVIRFLPRPADYLFLYFLGFYILMCSLKIDYRLAVLGALAFGFSTYFIIILGVGHNAKAHAIGYIPIVLAGIILVFRKKYLIGFIVTAIAMALEVQANHFQMTYYFMFLVLLLGASYLVYAIIDKTVKHYFISVGILLLAVVLGISANATNLLATKEYADWSTRGKSSLTIAPDGSSVNETSGLTNEYITQYSYGITESLNIFVPRLFGGANTESLGASSKTYAFLEDKGLSKSTILDFTSNLPLYWGDQPGVSAPAYVGAMLLFLALLGMFLAKGKQKWWLLSGILLSLVLSWGKNLSMVTDFMIAYIPLYNKFRAVSSIQVILELCLPILGVLGLHAFMKSSTLKETKWNALKWSFIGSIGLFLGLFLVQGLFDFESFRDDTIRQAYGDEIMTLIRLDRQSVYNWDLFRSALFVSLAAIVLYGYYTQKLKRNVVVVLLGILLLVDLIGVNQRYVNADDFVPKRAMLKPFPKTKVDTEILADNSIYRVYNPAEHLNGSRTSYYHKSIGGYHAAKPAKIEELFDFHIYQGNMKVLNMLNVKYVIQQDEDGSSYAAVNPQANGNAWFVQRILPVASANEEIMTLKNFDEKQEAVMLKSSATLPLHYTADSLATIELTDYKPNKLAYTTNTNENGYAVFSEMYYEHGWNAYVDGKLVPHQNVNFALRGMEIPAGQHTIVFAFEPTVVALGSRISLGGLGIFVSLIVIWILCLVFVKKKQQKQDA